MVGTALTLIFARPPIGVGNGDFVGGDDDAFSACFGCHSFDSNGAFAAFGAASFRFDAFHSACSMELCDDAANYNVIIGVFS